MLIGVLTVDALEWGFNEINECIEDFVCDIPNAAEIVQSCAYAPPHCVLLLARTNAIIQQRTWLTTVHGLFCQQDAKLVRHQPGYHKQGVA